MSLNLYKLVELPVLGEVSLYLLCIQVAELQAVIDRVHNIDVNAVISENSRLERELASKTSETVVLAAALKDARELLEETRESYSAEVGNIRQVYEDQVTSLRMELAATARALDEAQVQYATLREFLCHGVLTFFAH